MGINEPLDFVEAGPTDHLVPHVDLDVPLPLGVSDSEELGPQRPTPRTDIRVLDVGDAPLAAQCFFPALHDPAERLNAVVDVLLDRLALLLGERQHVIFACTGRQLSTTERATLPGAEQGMECSFRSFTVRTARPIRSHNRRYQRAMRIPVHFALNPGARRRRGPTSSAAPSAPNYSELSGAGIAAAICCSAGLGPARALWGDLGCAPPDLVRHPALRLLQRPALGVLALVETPLLDPPVHVADQGSARRRVHLQEPRLGHAA